MVPAAPCVEEGEAGYAVEAVSAEVEIYEAGGTYGGGGGDSGGAVPGGTYQPPRPPYQPQAPEPPAHAPSSYQQS